MKFDIIMSDEDEGEEAGRVIFRGIDAEYWFFNNHLHRVDGPAAVYQSGLIQWWFEGQHIHSAERFQQVSGLSDEDMTILILKYGEIQ